MSKPHKEAIRFIARSPKTKKIETTNILCECGLWFTTEKDFNEHLEKHKIGFSKIKKIPKPVTLSFVQHRRIRK